MSIHRKLTTVCCAAVLALGLAACGSDDDKVVTAPPIEPTTLKIATELAGRLESVDVAESLANAIKYAGMLSSEDVNGDSAMATANAEMVLTAETAINNAVTAADTAIKEANAAKLAAEDIENEAEKDAVMRLLDDAIETAMEVKTAAQAIIDGTTKSGDDEELNTLSLAVAEVEGANADMPNTAAKAGEAVAFAVRAAIAAVTTTNADVTLPAMGTVQMNDASDIGAMTWAMIVGEDNVMDVRRLVGGVAMEAMSVADSKVSDFFADDAGPMAATATLPDGTTYEEASYKKGIDGDVFCASSDCKVEDEDGTLVYTGSWYFVPDSTTELYVPAMAGSYTPAIMYARYGYWLTFDEQDGVAVNTFALRGNTATNIVSLDLGGEGDPIADVTASYTGKAAGISVRDKTSGHFTADVDLTATFGETSPMLGGTISGFDGNAANPDWNVTLDDTVLESTAAFAAQVGGITYGGLAAGNWTAQGYGPGQQGILK